MKKNSNLLFALGFIALAGCTGEQDGLNTENGAQTQASDAGMCPSNCVSVSGDGGLRDGGARDGGSQCICKAQDGSVIYLPWVTR